MTSIGFFHETLQDLEVSCDHAPSMRHAWVQPDMRGRNQGLTLPPRCHGRTVRCNRKQKDGFEAVLPRRPPASSSGSVVHCQVPVLGTHVLSQAPERELKPTSSSQDLSHFGSWYTSHQCTTSQVDVHSIGGSHLPRFLVNLLSWPRLPYRPVAPLALASRTRSHSKTATPSSQRTHEPCSIAANRRVSWLKHSIFYMISRLSTSFRTSPEAQLLADQPDL